MWPGVRESESGAGDGFGGHEVCVWIRVGDGRGGVGGAAGELVVVIEESVYLCVCEGVYLAEIRVEIRISLIDLLPTTIIDGPTTPEE